MSSCQSELSARDAKLLKLRSLLQRLQKQSDEQRSRSAAHNSERDTLLRCLANYRLLMQRRWVTQAACPSTATVTLPATSATASSTAPLLPPSDANAPLTAPVALVDDGSAVESTASSPSVKPSQLPCPLDDGVDVDECQPLLRVTLSDRSHWLLLSTQRDGQQLSTAAGTLAQQRHQQQQQQQRGVDSDERETDEDVEAERAAGLQRSVSQSRALAETDTANSPLFSGLSADSADGDGSAPRCVFWSELAVYLAYKWRKYQAAAKLNPPHSAAFAVLQPPSSSTLSSVDSSAPSMSSSTSGASVPLPHSSPLSSFVALLHSSSSLHCSLLLFDGACVPADCLTLLSQSLSDQHSDTLSRLRAVQLQRQAALSSAAREASLSHESVVRDFSRYQQRTRELVAQKQRQLDELLARDEDADTLRASLAAVSAQLDALNRDKSSQAASVVALAQQLQACQADKERALVGERTVASTLSALQADTARLREAAEARLASEQLRAEQAEEALQRMARQADDSNRRAMAATAAVAAAQQQAVQEQLATALPASAPLHTHRSLQSPRAATAVGSYVEEDSSSGDGALETHKQPAVAAPVRGLSSAESAPSLQVLVPPDSPGLDSTDGWSVDSSAASAASSSSSSSVSQMGEVASLRGRLRALQSLTQQREIAVVQLQAALDESSRACRALQSDVALLRSMESASNVEYLRNVLCRFLATDDDSLIAVLCTLLAVDRDTQHGIVAQRAAHSHGRARQQSGASAPTAAQPPSFFAFF